MEDYKGGPQAPDPKVEVPGGSGLIANSPEDVAGQSIQDSLRATREVIEGNLSVFRDQLFQVQAFMGQAVGDMQGAQVNALRQREQVIDASLKQDQEAMVEPEAPVAQPAPEVDAVRDAAVVDSEAIVGHAVMGDLAERGSLPTETCEDDATDEEPLP